MTCSCTSFLKDFQLFSDSEKALLWRLLNLNPVKLLLQFINIKGGNVKSPSLEWEWSDQTQAESQNLSPVKSWTIVSMSNKSARDYDHLEFVIRQASLLLILGVKDLNKSPNTSIKLWCMNDISIFQLIGQKWATAF